MPNGEEIFDEREAAGELEKGKQASRLEKALEEKVREKIRKAEEKAAKEAAKWLARMAKQALVWLWNSVILPILAFLAGTIEIWGPIVLVIIVIIIIIVGVKYAPYEDVGETINTEYPSVYSEMYNLEE